MAIKDTLIEIRERNGLTQAEMAERLFVTRQAVSRCCLLYTSRCV